MSSTPARRLVGLVRRVPDRVDVRRVLAPGRPQELRAVERVDLRPVGGRWEPTGPDPHLVFQPPKWGGFPTGVVELSWHLHLDVLHPVELELHVDTGQGYDEATKIVLPTTKGGDATVPVLLPNDLVSLRMDLPADVGVFDLRDVTLRRRPPPDDGRPALHWSGPQDAYRWWVALRDTPTEDDLRRLRADGERSRAGPTFSIVMPVHDPDPAHLRQSIESVLAQTWPHWQLCITDDASRDPAVRKVLSAFASSDGRIEVVTRSTNGHIATASNDALARATGEWIALLDHDDLLAVTALSSLAATAGRVPDAAVLYSDEDKVGTDGERFDPYFKPDFNLELLWGQNVVNHLGAYRADLVREVGGFRSSFDGSQDLDLLLRIVELAGADRVVHVPEVLYHWRVVAGSVAEGDEAKPWARDAGLRAVQEHLDRSGITGKVQPSGKGDGRRVRLDLGDPLPTVTVIVPTRDRPDLLGTCLEGLARLDWPGLEVIVVDNGSTSAAALGQLAEVGVRPGWRVLRDDRPFNWSALNNLAAAQATGDLLLFLNDDVEMGDDEWLRELVSWTSLAHVGAVGPLLTYPDGRIQHAGLLLGVAGGPSHAYQHLPSDTSGQMGRASLVQQVSALTGACLLTRRELFLELGGFDEEHLAIAYSDVDWCLRLRQHGHAVLWTPFAHLVHHESASRGADTGPREERRLRELAALRERWGTTADHDPFFNVNLSQEHTDFRVASVLTGG